jgi:plasmid stability protein
MLRHKAVKEAVRVAFGISGITDEDEARDIAKNTVAFEKVRVEKPVAEAPKLIEVEAVAVSADTTPKPDWAAELEKRIFEHEPKVNTFLIAKGQITEGQTFRDIADEGYRNRVLSNTPRFIDAVLKEVA